MVIVDLFCLRIENTVSKKFPFEPLETKTLTRLALYFYLFKLKTIGIVRLEHKEFFRYAVVH